MMSVIIKFPNLLTKSSAELLYQQIFKITPLRLCHTTYQYEENPSSKFFNKNVQTMLTTLTRVDYAKLFRKRRLGEKKVTEPVYQFMTDEQLEKARKDADAQAKLILQMPPVVKIRSPINEILSEDPALIGLETSRLVFTDITFGKTDSERLIVVREPDGTLRKAEWELRERLNQTYFPAEGKSLEPPKMFQPEYLKGILERQEYEFVLDKACYQFDVEDQEYHRICTAVYLHVNDNNSFDKLRSTRHFGPMTFFFVWFKQMDNLLLDLIETNYIEEAECLVKLFANIHNKEIESIDIYIKEFSSKRAPLELALQAHRDIQQELVRMKN